KFRRLHAEAAERIALAAHVAGTGALVQVSAIGADPKSEALYARTKADGEARVRKAFPSATILRPSIVFGPEDRFFNRFAALARISPALPLIGGGATKFQPVYVGDIAAAVEAVLSRDDTAGKTYDIAGPAVFTM